ncbi:YceI family protein [Croceitalea sp. MTPC5]|uniref:YceI family protein n=1 Tax=Croceitalea sp. MTPC5 TaxID=3056565 RepID=UPI002B367EBD|nr:YceI family protein [Croceitalea sp. MTPC5]
MKNNILLVFIGLYAITMVKAQNQIQIDTSKSFIKWAGSNLFSFNEHYGTVKFKNGVLIKDADSLSGGRFEIDMNSILNTDGEYNKGLVWHLKNEDFFHVEKYPIARLEMTNVTYSDSLNLRIDANLTIKNVTKPIVYEATLRHQNNSTVMTAKFIIDRTRWNVNYQSKSLLKSLKDETISDAIEFEVIVITKSN